MIPLPRSRGSQIYLLHLIAVAVGLVLVLSGPWRLGVNVIGGSFVAAALARAIVPTEHEGMLQVRGRAFDIFWMSTLGVSLVVLAFVVPPQPT